MAERSQIMSQPKPAWRLQNLCQCWPNPPDRFSGSLLVHRGQRPRNHCHLCCFFGLEPETSGWWQPASFKYIHTHTKGSNVIWSIDDYYIELYIDMFRLHKHSSSLLSLVWGLFTTHDWFLWPAWAACCPQARACGNQHSKGTWWHDGMPKRWKAPESIRIIRHTENHWETHPFRAQKLRR